MKKKETEALYDALSDSVLSLTDEELLEEIRSDGEDPDAVAERTHALMMRTLKDFRQRALVRAKADRSREIEKMNSFRQLLPNDPPERRDMLAGILKRQPAAGGVLTAQWRNLGELTDEDVETMLLELINLGFIGSDGEK